MKYEFNMDDAFQQIQRWIAEHKSIDETMNRAIEYCEAQCPDFVWRQARELNFQKNSAEIREWLLNVFEKQPPPSWVKGLWFGLCNPFHGGNPTCMLYLAGAREFDMKDPKAMWVREAEYLPLYTDQLWMAPSEVLQQLHKFSFGFPDRQGNFPDYANLLDYTLCLTFAAAAVLDCCETIDAAVWLDGKNELGIAAGFDDGDFLLLGKIKSDGIKNE